jgi:hypothetical protein
VKAAEGVQTGESSSPRLAPFGVDTPEATEAIAAAPRSVGIQPDEVWCASGSGVLARGLARAWPNARRHVVQVGQALSAAKSVAPRFMSPPCLSDANQKVGRHFLAISTTTQNLGGFVPRGKVQVACRSGTLQGRRCIEMRVGQSKWSPSLRWLCQHPRSASPDQRLSERMRGAVSAQLKNVGRS